MRDLLSWNVPLGRWAGVPVRLHVFFILLAVLAVYFGERAEVMPYSLAALAILFVSVLAHEFGHCFAAARIGGHADQLVLWPLGGLTHVNVSSDPQAELITALAGPLMNLSACLVLAPAMLAGETDFATLINPLEPPVPLAIHLTWHDVLRLTFWINWLLTLVNLLPAYPLDGGRALRAMIWQRWDYHVAARVTVSVAMSTAFVLCGVAWIVHYRYEFALLPLVLFGVFLFFSAKQEGEQMQEHEPGDAGLGYDFSQGYTSLDRQYDPRREREPGPLRRWLESRRLARLERQQQIEEEDERRVDEILARLHESGIDGLSSEDRALLDRVSARYRNRLRG
jgi:Zn-dependent protease